MHLDSWAAIQIRKDIFYYGTIRHDGIRYHKIPFDTIRYDLDNIFLPESNQVQESSNRTQPISNSHPAFYAGTQTETDIVLSRSIDFCCYYGYSLFIAVTHVWCSVLFVNHHNKALLYIGYTAGCLTYTHIHT